jgi:mRNA interferase RelE/StbE
MAFDIILAPEALQDLRRLKAAQRSVVKAALEEHLRRQPTMASRSRIKRLRGLSKPQYRLRVGTLRVFCDVTEDAVEVLAIVPRLETESWLAQFGRL